MYVSFLIPLPKTDMIVIHFTSALYTRTLGFYVPEGMALIYLFVEPKRVSVY